MNDLERKVLGEFSEEIGAPSGLVAERLGIPTAQVTRIAKKLAAEGLLEDTGYAMRYEGRKNHWQYIDRPKSEGGMLSKPGASTVWKTTLAGDAALSSGTAQENTLMTVDRKTLKPGDWIEVRDPTGHTSYGLGGAGAYQVVKVGRVNVKASIDVRYSPTGPWRHHVLTIPLHHVVRVIPSSEITPHDSVQERTMNSNHRSVADFNTLDDLIEHAARELGATHVVVSSTRQQAWIYFPRDDGSYEEARTWQKGGYWHAEGPGSRDVVSRPPRSAKQIGSALKETPRRGAKIVDNATAAGAKYAHEQINGDYFQQWVFDQLVEASQMDPSEVLPLETESDARKIAGNMLQQLDWDMARDLDSREVLSLSGTSEDHLQRSGVTTTTVFDAFREGVKGALRDESTVDWLGDEILRMNRELRGSDLRQLPLPGVNASRTGQRRARGVATYRITVKDWDRHYGEGHVVFKHTFDVKPAPEADAKAVEILEKAMADHGKPKGRQAAAWAERSDQHGLTPLRGYDGRDGVWVDTRRGVLTRPSTAEARLKAVRPAR